MLRNMGMEFRIYPLHIIQDIDPKTDKKAEEMLKQIKEERSCQT